SPAEPAAEGKVPGAMEAVPGAAAEVVAHDGSAVAKGEELSVEEQAIGGLPASTGAEESTEPSDKDEADTAALAEGLESPPLNDPDKL
ncbi:MAG: hypothetical protein ABSH08_13425, partial [Tepidisphaeraceae bacterium]